MTWTEHDNDAAAAKGWALFEHHGDEIELQLQAVDDELLRGDDSEAWDLVKRAFAAGDPLAARALDHLRTESPNEHRRITSQPLKPKRYRR